MFANTIYMINKIKFYNSFHNNVIYDFEAEEHLTFEKNRFWNKIWFALNDQWINISNNLFIIIDYKIMMIRNMLNDRSRKLLFNNIIYVSDSDVILMSVNVFQNNFFFEKWMIIRCFIKKQIKKSVCFKNISIFRFWSSMLCFQIY